jgi:aspartyl-tRNA(Asn)/glutamyl-tRNA(Gln) amidotransferase subunit A
LLADARERAAAWEPDLGAVVSEVDRPAEPGTAGGPLHGAVLGIKDLMAVAGAPLLRGAPALADPAPSEHDATAVARLAAAGASLAWTLQTHPLAFGIICPQTANPRATDRVAGGSSGGLAAAVAAGFVHGGLGTDTGGSVRIPAACCGVVGLKTTRGRVPLTGVADLAWSLDTVGPLAATVADAALLLDVVSGFDPADPVSEPVAPPPERDPSAPLRVGIPAQVASARMDDDVRSVWLGAVTALVEAGHRALPIDLPLLDGAHVSNGRVLAAEAAAVHEAALRERPDAFDPTVRPRLEHGLGLSAVEVARARRHGMLLRAQIWEAFAQVDVLCTPTLPCRVPPVGADEVVVGGERESVVAAMTRLTNPWNLTGVPAGSVPAGRDRDDAPVGVQVVGAWWDEPTVLRAMAALEEAVGGPWPAQAPR